MNFIAPNADKGGGGQKKMKILWPSYLEAPFSEMRCGFHQKHLALGMFALREWLWQQILGAKIAPLIYIKFSFPLQLGCRVYLGKNLILQERGPEITRWKPSTGPATETTGYN